MPSRPRSPALLALDLGTSSVRTALFDDKARIIPGSLAQQSYRVRHSAAHGAELDPGQLLRATHRALRATRRLTNRQLPTVSASGFWHSLLGLDRRGEPLTPIFTWADGRGWEDSVVLRRKLDERTIQQRTGCMLRASFWPAKLLWLRRTQPKLFLRVARWVSPAEWIFEQLFHLRACSHSMASGTGLYHLARQDWDEELLSLCHLTPAQLNPLQQQVEHQGTLFFPAIGDGAAGNLGSGAIAAGTLAINVGTSAAIRTVQRKAPDFPFGLFRLVVDRERTLLGGAISNAGNLRAWCLRELRLPNDDRAVEKILRQTGPASDRLTVLPFWVSERAPTWPDEMPGMVLGLSQATSAADLLVAVVTASFDRLAAIFRQLESAAGRARRIIVSGGILHSPASLQLLANSLGRELEVSDVQEASLRGGAVYGLEQIGRAIAPLHVGRKIKPSRALARQARARQAKQRSLEALLAKESGPF